MNCAQTSPISPIDQTEQQSRNVLTSSLIRQFAPVRRLVVTGGLCFGLIGILTSCEQQPESNQVSAKPLHIRALRRAFPGAPPVIPHPPLSGTCNSCHTPVGGRVVPEIGIAPANPHTQTPGMSEQSRCKQCHIFKQSDGTFVASDFMAAQPFRLRGDRSHVKAPPTVPHPGFMYEDCNACHTGAGARPEIACDHAERLRCRQCHIAGDRPDTEQFESGLELAGATGE